MDDGAPQANAVGSRKVWPPPISDVDAARRGDRDAMGQILSTGFPKLVAFYRGMGMRQSEAEDIAGEAIEGMVTSFPRLREPAAFEGWFWTVARNRVRSTLRKRGRVVYEPEYLSADDPGEVTVAHEEYSVIREVMAVLPIRDREILWLREVEELDYAEIAGRMGIAAGAARVAALRARRRLQAEYLLRRPDS